MIDGKAIIGTYFRTKQSAMGYINSRRYIWTDERYALCDFKDGYLVVARKLLS